MPTPIGVSPTSLLFDANGGEKTVKVDIKSYKYCGVTSDEKYDSWLTATANDDATITVKVAPNETGEERTAVIYAFGTDYQNVESLDQVAFKAIPITQKAGEGEADKGRRRTKCTKGQVGRMPHPTRIMALSLS